MKCLGCLVDSSRISGSKSESRIVQGMTEECPRDDLWVRRQGPEDVPVDGSENELVDRWMTGDLAKELAGESARGYTQFFL